MRTRQISHEFWVSESVSALDYFDRLLFQALWGLADREGLVLNRPARIKGEAFALDAKTTVKKVETGIEHLAKCNMIQLLKSLDGNVMTCIYIPNFLKFQNIHPNEARSKLQCNYIPCNVIEYPSASTSTSELKPSASTSGLVVGLFANPVEEVVKHLNTVTGKNYSLVKGNAEIVGALARGQTVPECIEVIDYCWSRWRDDPKWAKFVDKTTPFRKCNFERYLDEARAGTGNGGRRFENPYA